MLKAAPEPQKLVKDKWVKMSEPDFSLHYLEWVSFTHACLSLIFGAIAIYKDGFNFNAKTTVWEYIVICNSLSYFIYDTIVEFYYKTFDTGTLAHHIATISICSLSAYDSYGGSAMMVGLFYAEMSGPFYQVR